jgi:hypothetical protein
MSEHHHIDFADYAPFSDKELESIPGWSWDSSQGGAVLAKHLGRLMATMVRFAKERDEARRVARELAVSLLSCAGPNRREIELDEDELAECKAALAYPEVKP